MLFFSRLNVSLFNRGWTGVLCRASCAGRPVQGSAPTRPRPYQTSDLTTNSFLLTYFVKFFSFNYLSLHFINERDFFLLLCQVDLLLFDVFFYIIYIEVVNYLF